MQKSWQRHLAEVVLQGPDAEILTRLGMHDFQQENTATLFGASCRDNFLISLTIILAISRRRERRRQSKCNPSAEIVRVEGAECKWNCVSGWPWATFCDGRARRRRGMQAKSRASACGDQACRRCGMQVKLRLWVDAGNPVAIVCVDDVDCRWKRVCGWARATFCRDRAFRRRGMQVKLLFWVTLGNPLRRSCASKARNASEVVGNASAEIERAEGAECRWNVVFVGGHGQPSAKNRVCVCRRCRTQVKVRCGRTQGNLVRRSCVSKAQNAGEIAFCVCFEGCLRARLMFTVLMKVKFSDFGEVSWKTLVLGGFVLSFWESTRGKRWVWKTVFAAFAKVSWKTLVLGGFILSFLRKSRGKRSFWKSSVSVFGQAS